MDSWDLGLHMGANIAMVKLGFKQWAKHSFVSSAVKKIRIKNKLEEFQKNIENRKITPQIQKGELNLQCSYQNILRKEEEFRWLKSHSLWLQVGDKNTKKIHNQAKYRQLRNNVSKVTLEDGTIVTDLTEIKNVARSHFEDLHTQREEATQSNIEAMLENIPSKITNVENSDLNRPISEVEIHSAIWSLDPDKVPEPDGFTISFYCFFWNLIKIDLKHMLHFSCRTLRLGGNTNTSFLALFPKNLTQLL